MLGSVRLLLAILVVANHLWLPTANQVGAHAVAGFYVISGFLMTRIRQEAYCGPEGVFRFFVNRSLRIFPLYWLVCLSTLAGLFVFPTAFNGIHGAIRIPETLTEWTENATIFGLMYAPLRLVPPAWSLNVELIFYLAIGFGISRRRWGAYAWWLASLLYTIYLVWSGANFGDRYTPLDAASLFFATGAAAYHFLKDKKVPQIGMVPWACLLALFSLWPLLVSWLGGDLRMEGFYGAYMLFVPVFVWAVNFNNPRWARIDQVLGDLAYPVFLNHFFAAGMTNLLTGGRLAPFGLAHFGVSLVGGIGLALAMNFSVGSMVDRLRNKVRPRTGNLMYNSKKYGDGGQTYAKP